MTEQDLPLTRWEQGETGGYAARFADLIASGADVEGEARVADVLVGRHARILDAGAGMGRIGAALHRRGHAVVAAEKDPALVAELRHRYPELPVLQCDILALSRELLRDTGNVDAAAAGFDLIVLVGNVIVLLAPDTERRALSTLRDLLAPGGRILVGFHPVRMMSSARDYPVAEFTEDVEASGLQVQHLFGSYELAPPSEDYCVAVLTRA